MTNANFIHTSCFPSAPGPAATSRRLGTVLRHRSLLSAVYLCLSLSTDASFRERAYFCKHTWRRLNVPKPSQRKQMTAQNLQPPLYLDKSADSAACHHRHSQIFHLHLSLCCFNLRVSWSLGDKALSLHFKFTLPRGRPALFFIHLVCEWVTSRIQGIWALMKFVVSLVLYMILGYICVCLSEGELQNQRDSRVEDKWWTSCCCSWTDGKR